MLLTLYKTHRIEVEAREVARGGFGISTLGVWRPYLDGSEVYSPLWIADAGTFKNAESAEATGVQLAKLAIDDGTV